METETSAPGEKPQFLGIREQRVTGTVVFILTGLSVKLAPVLKVCNFQGGQILPKVLSMKTILNRKSC